MTLTRGHLSIHGSLDCISLHFIFICELYFENSKADFVDLNNIYLYEVDKTVKGTTCGDEPIASVAGSYN